MLKVSARSDAHRKVLFSAPCASALAFGGSSVPAQRLTGDRGRQLADAPGGGQVRSTPDGNHGDNNGAQL